MISFYKKQITLLGLSLLAIFDYFYLTKESFLARLGMEGSSLCKVSEKFDCSIVSSSPFSALGGIPISLWGMMAYVILIVLVVWHRSVIDEQKAGSDKPNLQDLESFLAMLLSGLSHIILLTSLVMAFVLFFVLKFYCLFCIFGYVLALFTWGAVFWTVGFRLPDAHFFTVLRDKKSLKVLAVLAVLYFGAVFIGNRVYLDIYNVKDKEAMAQETVDFWSTNTIHKDVFEKLEDLKPLTIGSSQAPVHLVEFADFLCPHCKSFSKTLDQLLKRHGTENLRISFYPFPLDKQCNRPHSARAWHKLYFGKSLLVQPKGRSHFGLELP